MVEKVLQQLCNVKEQIPLLNDEHKTLQPIIQEKRTQIEKLENEAEAKKTTETEVNTLDYNLYKKLISFVKE